LNQTALALNPSLVSVDGEKAEEIARTVYVGNISSAISEEDLIRFIATVGPVAYCKLAGDASQVFFFKKIINFLSFGQKL